MVSVIITTYKREPTLVIRAIDSVLSQTYRDIEIVVVDDSPNDYQYRNDIKMAVNSKDQTIEKIRIHYIEHEKNMGACAARNTGLKYAKGEYIAYLDDDDEWLPGKLEKQMMVMQETKASLVYCGRICMNDTTKQYIDEDVEFYRGNVFDKLIYHNFIGSTSFPLIKTKCLEKIGGFDVQMQSAQDYDVWLRIAEKEIVDFVAEPLVVYHVHDGEQISSNPIKKINGLVRINQKNRMYLESDPAIWYRRNTVIIPYYVMSGNMNKAVNVWKTCVCKCPLKIADNLKYLKAIVKGIKKSKHE